MNLPKILLSSQGTEIENKISKDLEILPFFVKEIGYIHDRHFSRGNYHNHTEFLMVFTLSAMNFSKYTAPHQLQPYDLVLSSCHTVLDFVQPRRKKQPFFYMVIGGKHAQQFYNLVRNNDSIHHTSQQQNFLDLFTTLLNIDYKKDPMLAQLKAGACIYQIFQKLYQISLDIAESRLAAPLPELAVKTAISYIEKNYQHNLDIDTICANVGFSKYYFCKLFKEHTGVTIHQYVTEFRINKSKHLLSYSKLTIANVASSVGYHNSLTFARSFEKLVHMTPSEYRERY